MRSLESSVKVVSENLCLLSDEQPAGIVRQAPCELEACLFIRRVHNLRGHVRDKDFKVIAGRNVVEDKGRSKELVEPSGFIEREVAGLDVLFLLYGLVVERNDPLALRFLSADVGFGGGFADDVNEVGNIEGIVEEERDGRNIVRVIYRHIPLSAHRRSRQQPSENFAL